MEQQFTRGDQIEWPVGHRRATGVVRDVYHRKVVRTIRGERIVRYGRVDDPALLLERSDGRLFLKLRSEIQH